jgi:assimilatory nitrate reductase catalytic subunit
VQEAFATTATCAYADLLLPATTWGEKDGTVTNSERCISRVRPAISAPGAARHDWQIAVDFAVKLGSDPNFSPRDQANGATSQKLGSDSFFTDRQHRALFSYPTPESIWNEHRESTRNRDLDITGMSYQLLEQAPQQWPMPEGQTTGKKRLYQDAVFPTPDGKASFVNTVYKPVAEPSIQMNPQDMARRLLKEGDLVHVTSKRGSILVPLQASPDVGMNQAFMAMHWGGEFLSGVSSTGDKLAGVNALTTSAYCPSAKQPELKHAAVKILKAELPWSLLGVAWLPEDEALQAREQLILLCIQ